MNPIYLILMACIGYPIFQSEMYRYTECLELCWKKHTANVNLLRNEICINPKKRLEFKTAGTVHCEKAENDLLLTPVQCAIKNWWKKHEIVNLYNTMTQSYWSIMAIVMPVILFVIYLTFRGIMQSRSETKFLEYQWKFFDNFVPKQKQKQRIKSRRSYDYDTSPMLKLN